MASRQQNPVTQVMVFGIGFGAIMAIAAYLTLTGLKGAPDLWGEKRSLAIGLPLALISAAFLFSGISLMVTKSKWAVVCSIVSAFVAAGFYFMFELSTIGIGRGMLISAIAYALPFAILIYGRKAIEYIDETASLPQNAPHNEESTGAPYPPLR